MRLYHTAYSSNARRALMTALHLGVKLDLEVVDLQKGDQRKPDMLRMNPNGKVPVMDDDGFLLWESHAIMQYLADRTPGQTVYPQELRARADVNRWLFWSAHHWSPSVSILAWENFVKGLIGAGAPDPLQVKRGEEQVTACARLLDAHLSWKSGSFDVRDVTIVPKPLQKPHPPLWQAAVSPPAFDQAGRNGVGVLATTMLASIESVAKLVDLYRASIRACERPVGKVVNNQVANFTFVHCAESWREARENACASAVAWYVRTAGEFFEVQEIFKHMAAESTAAAADVAGGGLAGKFIRENANAKVPRAQALIGRVMMGEKVPEDEMFETLLEEHSIIVGTLAECRKKVKNYQEMGIDRLMCLHQVGAMRHDKVMKSMRLFSELIPEFDRS